MSDRIKSDFSDRAAGPRYGKSSGPLVRRFSPYDFDDEQVLRQSTGRDNLLNRILRVIQENLERREPPNQHLMVLGNRGMGKSFLIRRVQIEVERLSRQGKPVVFVRLPEEQLNVSAPELLLDEIRRILTHTSADTVRVKWQSGEEKEWHESVAALRSDIVGQPGFSQDSGLLVVSIENFDVLLADVFGEDAAQSRLREFLAVEPRVMFLATSTTEADNKHNQRLFQAFRREQLPAWGPDEFVEFYRKTFTGEITLGLEAKIRALAHFMGGSPRLAVLIGDVLHTNDALSAVQTLDQLADELTPYFQDRIMTRLGRKSRWLLDDLLRGGEPCSQVELARRVGASQPEIGKPFAALLREGVVVDQKQKGKRGQYVVADRVFAHYYRKRYLADQSHSPLAYMVEFLEDFYNQRERAEQLFKLVKAGREDEAKVIAETLRHGWGAWGKVNEGSRIRDARRMIRLTCQCLGQEAESGFWKEFSALADQMGPKQATKTMNDVQKLADLAQNPTELIASDLALAAVFLTLPNDEMAIEHSKKALEKSREIGHGVLDQLSLHSLGFAEFISGKGACAKEHFNELMTQAGGIACNHLYAETVSDQMWNLIAMGEFNKALEVFEQARADPKILQDRRAMAGLYYQLGYARQYDIKAGLEATKMAVELCREAGDDALLSLAAGNLSWFFNLLKCYDEALSAARVAREAGRRAGDDFLILSAIHHELSCLNDSSEHQALIEAAPAMVELARKLEDPIREAQAQWMLADAYQELDQTDKALSARRATVEASLCSQNYEIISMYYIILFKNLQAIGAACIQEIVDHFRNWVEHWVATKDSQEREYPPLNPAFLFDILAKAATLSDRWPEVVDLLTNTPEFSDEVTGSSPAVGDALVELYEAEGPGPAFSAMAGFLRALREPLGRPSTDDKLDPLFRTLFRTTCSRLVAKLSHPGLLRDIAQEIREQLNAIDIAEIFEAAALYRENPGEPEVLDGVDPDIGKTLRAVLGIAASGQEPEIRKTESS